MPCSVSSDSPETNAAEWTTTYSGAKAVDSEFARQLERERNAAIDALQYIAHSGLSARHLSKFALEFLNDKTPAKQPNE